MQIDFSDGGCLSVMVSDEELASMGMSFEKLDWHDPETRNVLHTLLQVAKHEVGYIPYGTVLVEALPLEGGCLFLITPEDTKTPDAPEIFRIPDAETLLQLAAAIGRDTPPGSLYRTENGYWLTVKGHAPQAVYECAEPIYDRHMACRVTEYGTVIFAKDALWRLKKAVSG